MPPAAVPIALVLLAAIAFSPVLSNGFITFDDPDHITENAHVARGLTWEGVRWAVVPSRESNGYWRPLSSLSFMLDVELFGMRPGPMHAENLLLHAASAVLLFLALRRMTGRAARSAAVALLFVVHPLHVEAIAWAAERKTVLAGSLAFGALLAYARYVERPSVRRYLWVPALLLPSLLAKAMVGATLPALLLVLDVWPLGRTRWVAGERDDARRAPEPVTRLLLEKLPLLAMVAGVIAVLTSWPSVTVAVPLSIRLGNAAVGYWCYLAKTVWPAKLALFYPQLTSISGWTLAGTIAGLAAVTAVLLLVPRVPRAALVGWLWFLGSMLPVSGLVRHATLDGMWPAYADRFMYFPLAGLLLAAVWTVAPALRAPRVRQAALALLALAVIAEAARSHAYARRWHDSEALFRTTVEVTGDRATYMRANLGMVLQNQGRYDEARAVLEELVRLAPENPAGHVNLGLLSHLSGDLVAAEIAYRRALALDPGRGEALYNLGLLELRHGRADEGLALIESAIRAGIQSADAYNRLGASYVAAGRDAEAERAFREALLREQRHWRAAVNLATLLARHGNLLEARSLLAEARRGVQPTGEDPSAIDEAQRQIDALAR